MSEVYHDRSYMADVVCFEDKLQRTTCIPAEILILILIMPNAAWIFTCKKSKE